MTAAAIKATYSDYRRVKGRKVLQLIFEVPLEQAPEVHQTFGEPSPDGSLWVGIALLTSDGIILGASGERPTKPETDDPGLSEIPLPGKSSDLTATNSRKAPGADYKQDAAEFNTHMDAKAAKPKRTWDQLSRAEQAGIACEDSAFQKYVGLSTAYSTANYVRRYCGVDSRADLNSVADSAHAEKWDKLYSDYQMWKQGAVHY